jgi:nitrite reductase/ring-hydroxylating ferredoxin subunit
VKTQLGTQYNIRKKMTKRWKRGPSVTLKALLFSLLSVAAFLDPRPLLNPDAGIRNKHNVWKVSHLNAKNKNKNNDRADNEGLANFFRGSKEKKEEVVAKTSPSQGVLKSLSKWREGRKIKAETERQEKEASRGQNEVSEQGSFFPDGFDATLFFRRSSNKEKEAGMQEKAEVKSKAATERERIRNKQGNSKAKDTKRSNEAPSDSGETGADGKRDSNSKRSNPLSVVQKYVANVLAKQNSIEEWVAVASKTSIAPGALVPVSAGGLDLLLVASKDGSALHCIANSCPHLGTPLEIGTLERRPIEYPESEPNNAIEKSPILQETTIAKLLAQDGCEGCIVCPLHKTAFALDSGEVRGVSWSCFCRFRSDVHYIVFLTVVLL